jgi:two-component system response regulator HydG
MAKTILIIDDEESIRNLLVRFFTMKGLRVITAESVGAARECISDCDMVLSDVRIGDENGLEFIEEIRGHGTVKPFLFMSGEQIDTECEKAIELTGHPVLFKPDITRVVFEIVERILAG